MRGVRQHAHKLLKQLQEGDVERANLGLGVRLPIGDLRLSKSGLIECDGVTARLFEGKGQVQCTEERQSYYTSVIADSPSLRR